MNHGYYSKDGSFLNGVQVIFDDEWYYFESNAEEDAFQARYGVDPSAIAEHRSRAKAIIEMSATIKTSWLAARGWRIGFWLQDGGPGFTHARKLCQLAEMTGDETLIVDTDIDEEYRCCRIPATDPVALMLACRRQLLSFRVVPPSCAFAVCHEMDGIATYAAPSAMMPMLSLFDSADEERAHAQDYQQFVCRGDDGLIPLLLRRFDGHWWWQ